MTKCLIKHTDAASLLASMPANSVDLVFMSPPYEDVRTYGIDFALKGADWVHWFADIMEDCVRVCKGLVAAVVEGKTRQYSWSGTPVLLQAELLRRGITLRKPPAFYRHGIPGSGGPDWLRNDYEFIVCATSGGRLPWSQPTACGKPPKWKPGGAPSHRMKNGRRVHKLHTKADADGKREQGYNPPKKANPGNVIKCVVGGGRMGSPLAHENEAPFPESLAEFFVKTFCPPGGIVCDPFVGSGTTAKVAGVNGRHFIGCDVRQEQVSLSQLRVTTEANGIRFKNPSQPPDTSLRPSESQSQQCADDQDTERT